MIDPFVIPGADLENRTDSAAINTQQAPVDVQVAPNEPSMTAVEPSFLEVIGDRIGPVSAYQSIVRSIRLDQASENSLPLQLEPEAMYNRLEREGVTEFMSIDDYDSFANVRTQREFDLRLQYLIERKQTEQQINDLGFFKGLVAEMVAYSVDPISLNVDFAAGAPGKGAALVRFLSGGARAAVANGLIETILTVDDRAFRPGDIGFAVAAAFGLGGAFGVAFGSKPTIPDNRTKPFTEKHSELADPQPTATIPKSMFDPDGTRPKADDVGPEPTARVDAVGSARVDEVNTPAASRAKSTIPDAVLEQLKTRAAKRLSDDDLAKDLETVDNLGALPNPTDVQLARLEKATKRLDDHEDAQKAIAELESAQATSYSRVEDIPAVQRQFEGAEAIKDILQKRVVGVIDDVDSSVDNADAPIDMALDEALQPKTRNASYEVDDIVAADAASQKGLSADQVEEIELVNDAYFGIARENQEELTVSFAQDVAYGDDGFVSRMWKRISPATQARILNNPHIRVLASRMFTHPWLVRGDDFNKTGWEDTARRLFMGPEALRLRKHRDAFEEWYADQNPRKMFAKLQSITAFKMQKIFAEEVGSAVQSLNAGRTPDVHPAVLKAAKAFDEFGATHWRQLQDSGAVPRDMPRPYEYYLPQLVDRDVTRQFTNNFQDFGTGLGVLKELYKRAMRVSLRRELIDLVNKASDNKITPKTQALLDSLEESLSDVIAMAYARRAYSHDVSVTGMFATDGFGLHLSNVEELKSFLQKNLIENRSPGEKINIVEIQGQIDSVINSLTRNQKKRTDSKFPDRLKNRLDLDMDTSVNYVNRRGEVETVRLGDFYHRDVNHTAHNYGRWAAAEATLARDGTSVAQVRAAIDELRAEAGDRKINPDVPTLAELDLLEYGYRAVMNLPAHTDKETLIRATNALKNLAFASKMGAAFLHTASEAYTIAAQMGVGKTLKEFPVFMKMLRNYQKGTIDPGLQQDLYNMNGAVFNSLDISLGGSRFDTDLAGFSENRALELFERGAEGLKRLSSYVNLLPVSTDLTRQFATYMQLKQLDQALRGEKMPAFWDGLRRQYGLSDRHIDVLREHFLSNKVSRKADGSLDWDGDIGLDSMSPEARFALEDFIYRGTTTMIQEVHRGNLPMFMTGPIGSLMLQFRSFEVASTTRHLFADLNRRDRLALNKFIGSAMIASLGYAARVYMYSGGDKEVIEERLQPDRILMNGIAYSVSAGLMPSVVDTVSYRLTGGITPFNRFRTTGMSDNLNPLDTLGIGTAPALGVLGDVWTGLVDTPIQLGWDAASGETPRLSREQARALFTVVGADTMWFLRPLKEYTLANMPKESELDRGNLLIATGLDE